MTITRVARAHLLSVLAVSEVMGCARSDAPVTVRPQPQAQPPATATQPARPAAAQSPAIRETNPNNPLPDKPQAKPAPSGWGTAEVFADVVYCELEQGKLHMDLAVPEGSGPFPAIAMFPGGMPVQDARQGLHPAMQFFLRHGYVVATVEYRGPAAGQFPAPVDDAKNAVRFLRKHADKYRVDPQRIGAWGMSMGAGVALMLAVTDDDFGTSKAGPYGRFSSRVQAVVDRYGPADFTTFPLDLQSRLFMALSLGSTDPKSPQLRQASPVSHVSKTAAPVLALHCRQDQVVPFSQSEAFCAAMRKAGAAAELREIRGGGHASEMGGQTPDDRAANDECRERELAWFDRYLKGPQ